MAACCAWRWTRAEHQHADLIADGLLIDLKTNLGDKRADGTRQASLDATTVYQILGYLLLDFADGFAIDYLGL